MANNEDIARLGQGLTAWNDWRAQHPACPVDLRWENFSGAKFSRANLRQVSLACANFSLADLREANLEGASLERVSFYQANLEGANLSYADLIMASFYQANLEGANLRASLLLTNFTDVNLTDANFSEATLLDTVFANVDLTTTKGLDACKHLGPSILDHRTLLRSGQLPLTFLRGCGLPDRLIDYLPSLLNEAIQYYSCFISYSSKDDPFAKKLHADLQNSGVRCWFAPHDLPIGAKTWDAIDDAIKLRDKLLLILSKHSIGSDWVEDEVIKAYAEERRRGATVLFPVRIDDTVMTTPEPWAVKLRDQRNIGDFTRWRDRDAYQQTFDRMLRNLKAAQHQHAGPQASVDRWWEDFYRTPE